MAYRPSILPELDLILCLQRMFAMLAGRALRAFQQVLCFGWGTTSADTPYANDMMNSRLSLLLVLSLFFASCAVGRQSTNDPIDATALSQLEPGKTTAGQVVSLFGGPTEVVQLGRRTAYLYSASTTKSAALILLVFNMGNQDTRTDRLWVFFDENDVLSHYGASMGTHRTQYAMPYEDIHEASDNEARDVKRPGVVEAK